MASDSGAARLALVLVFGALLIGGCANLHLPDGSAEDEDQRQCVNGPRPTAIAACKRILARPDPPRWYGPLAASTVHFARARTAWYLAGHLAADDQDEESYFAALRSIALFEQYDRETFKSTAPEQRVIVAQQTALFNAHLARAVYAAGLQLMRLRRWPDALPHLQRAVRLDGRHAVAWATLGVAANQSWDHATAMRAFERALEIEPGYFTEARSIQREIFEASRDSRRLELIPPRSVKDP
ncbi:MAG TPA: hypothetical protein VJS92_01175 [Candidatus Polarisedimenticolaceae bacterium]|nr:hypothetical protein [Candidatus Polarisedimenticolaceae bacterium]